MTFNHLCAGLSSLGIIFKVFFLDINGYMLMVD